jgi:hypothetical protein
MVHPALIKNWLLFEPELLFCLKPNYPFLLANTLLWYSEQNPSPSFPLPASVTILIHAWFSLVPWRQRLQFLWNVETDLPKITGCHISQDIEACIKGNLLRKM